MFQILVADTLRPPIRKGTVRLLWVDPPRNLGRNEGATDDYLSRNDYKRFVYNFLDKILPLMAPQSWLVLCLSPHTRQVYENIMRERYPFTPFVQEIIWHYDFGLYTRSMFVKSHDNCLLFRKGKPDFYWEQVAIVSQRMFSGDSRADWRGRTPGSVWSIPRVPGNSFHRRDLIDKHTRSCQPEELVRRFVLALTKPYHIVCDPFLGTGTTAKVCYQEARQFIGWDICGHYVQEVQTRLDSKREFMRIKA